MVTASEIRTFQSATSSELQQAQSLIFRGKGFAARGDPRLSAIIAVLGTLQQVARDRAIAEAQAREQVQTLARAEDIALQSFPVQVQTLIPPTQIQLREQQLFQPTVVGVPQPTGILERSLAEVQATRRQIAQRDQEGILKQAKLLGLTIPTSALGLSLFVKSFVTDPVGTAKQIPGSIKRQLKFATSGELARLIRDEPGTVVGIAATEILIAKGLGKGVSVVGGKVITTTKNITPLLKKIITVPKGKKGQARTFEQLTEALRKEGKEISLDDVINDLKFKKVGKVVKEKSRVEKISDIRKIFNELKKEKDPILRQKQIKDISRLLKEAHGETQARSLIKDFLAQEGITPSVRRPTGALAPTAPEAIGALLIEAPGIPQVELSAEQLLLENKFSPLSGGKQIFFQDTGTRLKVSLESKESQLSATIPALRTAFKQATTQSEKLRLAQALRNAQDQLQRTKQLTKQLVKSKTLLKQFSPLKTLQNLFIQPIKKPVTKKKAKPRPRPRPKIPRIPTGVEKTKLVKRLVQLKKQGVNVVVGMGKKQKIVAKNLPPFKALKFGRDFVDKNIAASFRLKKTGKKTKKKDIKPFNVGKKFRPSKVNPLFIVEKRKFRLDSPSEKRQIKAAPRRKKNRKKK